MVQTYAAFTTFHKSGYETYGQKNIDSFLRHWPKSINYHVYAEGFKLEPKPRLFVYDLVPTIPDLQVFKNRHKNNPKAHGKMKTGSMSDPSSFLFDFVRFSHKSFVMFHAIYNLTTDWVIWLDGDSFTHTSLDLKFLNSICPTKALVSFLGRDDMYTETGFIAFNRRHPKIKEYVRLAKQIYETDLVFKDQYFKDGYTDCHVFDYAIRRLTRDGVTVNNLTKGIPGKHPFINGPLGAYMDHLKGPRKNRGASSKSDIKVKTMLNHPYWKSKK